MHRFSDRIATPGSQHRSRDSPTTPQDACGSRGRGEVYGRFQPASRMGSRPRFRPLPGNTDRVPTTPGDGGFALSHHPGVLNRPIRNDASVRGVRIPSRSTSAIQGARNRRSSKSRQWPLLSGQNHRTCQHPRKKQDVIGRPSMLFSLRESPLRSCPGCPDA